MRSWGLVVVLVFLQKVVAISAATRTTTTKEHGRRLRGEQVRGNDKSSSSNSVEERNFHYPDEIVVKEKNDEGGDKNNIKYPFLVSLMDGGFDHVCGGSLVARDMVLTAASCEDGATLRYARFQENTIRGDELVEIKGTFPHPEYNQLSLEHNTMLVQLNRTVEANDDSSLVVQMMLKDANDHRPSKWPVPILKEGQTLIGFNYHESSKRYSNDISDKDDLLQTEWGEWQLGYVGKDSCRNDSKFVTEDSLCLNRGDVQLFSSGWTLCQPGEVGGPILWMSDATNNARILLGVNTWGIGCRSSALPNVAGLVNADSAFLRNVICTESDRPPSYIGCSPFNPTTSMANNGLSGEFLDLFGIPSKGARVVALEEAVLETQNDQPPDQVMVYVLFLFHSSTAGFISWTITESSTNAIVASAIDGTYDSVTDVTELVTLVPGVSYKLEITSNSNSSSGITPTDRVLGVTDFALILSEPAQEILQGQIAPGTSQSFAIVVGMTHSVEPLSAPEILRPVSLCANRGETCISNVDCCSNRCSPYGQCAPQAPSGSREKLVAAGMVESSYSRPFGN